MHHREKRKARPVCVKGSVFLLSFKVPASSGTYKLNVCGSVTDKACKKSPVCLVSGTSASSFGLSQAMSLNYSREEQEVIMQYGGGDPCPSGQPRHTQREEMSMTVQQVKQWFQN